MNLLIVMAMRGEAAPIVEKLKLKSLGQKYAPIPTLCFEGHYQKFKISLQVNGVDPTSHMDSICTQPTTVSTLLGIQNYKPNIIMNFGTCGALGSKGFKIGDLVLSVDRVWFHARRIPLEGWDSYGRGGYPSAGTRSLAAQLGFKPGVLSTADSLDFPSLDAHEFNNVHGDIADMEGASIAWLSQIYGIPFYSLKGVTDLMDANRKTGEQFEENFATVVEMISTAAIRLIDAVN